MKNINPKSSFRRSMMGVALALAACGAFAASPAWADNGKRNQGKEHGANKEHGDRGREADRNGAAVTFSFSSDDRRIVGEYYGAQVRDGHCPPGLAKKNNGCQPPGQAKKWQKGRPLATDIEYHEVPMELRVRLPVPPPNHRYVQIAGDILMIAVGSGMVVDAIEDILR